MRHIYRLYKTHNQFQPVLAKMAEKTLFLAQKCNFKAFFELSGSLGGLGGPDRCEIAMGHWVVYIKGPPFQSI